MNSVRKGLFLEYATLGWNVIGAAVVLFAAYAARSVALAGFGIDSVIEIFASVVVVWQLKSINKEKEKFAERLIGFAFLLLTLYISLQSAIVLIEQFHPRTSLPGMAWLSLTAIAMFFLAREKAETGRAINNPVLKKESRITVVDGLLAAATLLGLSLNYFFGFWWADPLTGFVLAGYGAYEGVIAFA